MKMCDAVGNGVCVNCNRTPPKVNGYSCGDVCRKDVEDVLLALEHFNMVCYNSDDGKFYQKEMYTHPATYMDDDWEAIG